MLNNTCILVRLTIGMPPQTKRSIGASEEVEARYRTAPKQAKVSKSLFSKKDIGNLQKVASHARTVFNEISLPYDVGSRIIPSSTFFEFTQRMSTLSSIFDTSKAEFLNNYHISLMRAEQELGDLFDPDDYPEVSRLDDVIQLSIESDVIPPSNAYDDLVGLDKAAIDKMKSDAVAGQQAKVDEALRDLFKRLSKSLNKAAVRLAEKDGVFRDTLVGNIHAALEAVETLNITNDQDLIDLADSVRDVLDGITANDLRNDKDLRSETATNARGLVNKISEFF